METPPICCGNFEKMLSAFQWFTIADGDTDKLLMPYIETKGVKWRVNNCPSCGAEVRAAQVTREQYLDSY